MHHPDVRRRIAYRLPAEPDEEADVGQLNVGDHAASTQLASRAHGKANQWCPDAVAAECGQHSEPVALPLPGLVERVQPHGPCGYAVDEAEHMHRCRVTVVVVSVVGGEKTLLHDEDLAPDGMVNLAFARIGDRTADDVN